jgi:RNA polymerase sigma-70 factor (ECF subfamily)
LFDEYEAAMREYCSRRLGGHDANDAAAEVFLAAWRRIDEVPSGEDARLWLYGVARNVVRNASRSRQRRARLGAKAAATPSNPGEGVEEVVVRRQEDRLVLQAMAKLSDDDQELLRLQLWEELSRDQIADVLGISTDAVGSRLTRAKKRAAKQLKSIGLSPQVSTRPRAAEGGDS